jgi:integrase
MNFKEALHQLETHLEGCNNPDCSICKLNKDALRIMKATHAQLMLAIESKEQIEKQNIDLKETLAKAKKINNEALTVIRMWDRVADLFNDKMRIGEFESDEVIRLVQAMQKKLASLKYLNRKEVERVYDKALYEFMAAATTKDISNLRDKSITSILELAYDRNRIAAVLMGQVLDTPKDAIAIADEVVKGLVGKYE